MACVAEGHARRVEALRQKAWRRLLAAKPPGWVPSHCRCVEALASAMCDCAEEQGFDVDRDLVAQAALLHDIGRSVTQDVRHAGVGADLLRKDGHGVWDQRVILCVERHTGAGIDAAEAARLGLPVKDYTPRTLEEKIVAHADNLYTGDKRISLGQVVAKYDAKGLKAAAQKVRRLHEELAGILGADLETLAPAQLPPL